MLELTVSNLDMIDDEPRILDLTLADHLGFARPRAVRQLIERSRIELESYGLIATRCGAYRNRQYNEYWLSETQALLVCVLSRTEKAAEVRRVLVTVFTAWRCGQLISSGPPGDLTREQRKAINSQAWALASEEARTAFQKHQARLLREALGVAAIGRPIKAALDDNKNPE